MPRKMVGFSSLLLLISLQCAAQQQIHAFAKSFNASGQVQVLPHNFYSNNLALFCKTELGMNKRLPFQFLFRLGSKNYVDYLEKKPGSIYMRWLTAHHIKIFCDDFLCRCRNGRCFRIGLFLGPKQTDRCGNAPAHDGIGSGKILLLQVHQSCTLVFRQSV